MTDNDLQHLQAMEHNLQQLLAQKQQFQSQHFELASALEEVAATTEAYKIIGGILIKKLPEDLKKELVEKQELTKLRIESVEKQERALQERAQALQKKVLAAMNKEQEKNKRDDELLS